MTTKPESGTPLRTDDVEMIIEAVAARQTLWPNEPADMTLRVVLYNIGDRFTQVACVEGEWVGHKSDFPLTLNGVPKCPNGHVCMQGKGMRLGWIDDA